MASQHNPKSYESFRNFSSLSSRQRRIRSNHSSPSIQSTQQQTQQRTQRATEGSNGPLYRTPQRRSQATPAQEPSRATPETFESRIDSKESDTSDKKSAGQTTVPSSSTAPANVSADDEERYYSDPADPVISTQHTRYWTVPSGIVSGEQLAVFYKRKEEERRNYWCREWFTSQDKVLKLVNTLNIEYHADPPIPVPSDQWKAGKHQHFVPKRGDIYCTCSCCHYECPTHSL